MALFREVKGAGVQFNQSSLGSSLHRIKAEFRLSNLDTTDTKEAKDTATFVHPLSDRQPGRLAAKCANLISTKCVAQVHWLPSIRSNG